ncbi:hypothetical protein HOLleu_37554 [Holothuria leucospilota]|uniref:Uncharacterized protein n=1 Tax=Holothuria leucospilota TaxID=206669 RepID=A0A9Q0YM11_HOLLE|nr:hypothetical protein HOLleu_37554 [Holothuria leucospilota]
MGIQKLTSCLEFSEHYQLQLMKLGQELLPYQITNQHSLTGTRTHLQQVWLLWTMMD